MAIIPLKQTITITRVGELGDWGVPTGSSETFTLKCRIDEGSRMARTDLNVGGGSGINSEEVIEVTSILLNKYADVRYTDTITFTDAGGKLVTVRPIKISVISGLNGKPVLTEVIV